ncbi:MAG: 50S ribosomal protein L21 [Chloroflexota bacterium]
MYAIIETGGKQYKVSPGLVLDVERLDVAEGKQVELDRVLLVGDGDKVTVGTPVVDGARVIATARGEFKDKKVVVMKYKAKTRYHKKTGHRQILTKLVIDQIVAPGMAEETAAPKPARKRTRRTTAAKEESADGA